MAKLASYSTCGKVVAILGVLLIALATPGWAATADKYCSHHGGICGCSGANDRCCDGSISSAPCDPEDTPPWNRPMQCMELVPAMKEMGAPPIVDPAHWVATSDCDHPTESGDKCFCIDQAGIDARSGCCSHHGGACGCSGKSVTCCDGSTSPTCTCHNVSPKHARRSALDQRKGG